MLYNECIGQESIEVEYKVFNFNPLKLSVEDGLKYLSNGIFCFNDSIDETIKNYFEIYLPKYLCSFFNPTSKISNGYLYFGIDDNGKVIGIPYLGNINLNFINYMIDKILRSKIKFKSFETKNKIKKSIKVEVIKVDTNTNTNANKKTTYTKYLEELNKIKNEHKIYKNKRHMWNKIFDLDKLKLYEMINDLETRKYIWKYTKIKSKYSKNIFRNKYSHLNIYCDVYDYWNLMTDVKTNKLFLPLKQGAICKFNDNNLDVYKWVANWKDSKLSMLKKAKPKKPIKKIDTYYPLFILSQVPRMMPEWIKNNPELNIFVIKITFEVSNRQEFLEFIDNENKWKYSYRTLIGNEPMSPSFYSSSS